MNWLTKLERKFGRYAIPNLMYYIIILYGLGFILELVNPYFYYQYLSLDAAAILSGQVWRIITFIIQPPSSSAIFMIFALYLYYMIGKELERAWGHSDLICTFLQVYYFMLLLHLSYTL